MAEAEGLLAGVLMTTEEKLKEIARQILAMNENDLMALLPTYQERMESFSTISEWEESVVLYFLINGYRIKNIQFCERVNQLNSRRKPGKGTKEPKEPKEPKGAKGAKAPQRPKPHLILVK
jgi:hypothetical protein